MVDFPEPERPSKPTICPSASEKLMSSRTSMSSPSGLGKAWRTDWICSNASLLNTTLSPEPEFSLGVPTQRPPERPIDNDHEQAHHSNPEHNAGQVARLR